MTDKIKRYNFNHLTYKPADIEDCDGCAWLWKDDKTRVLAPFKFPELRDDEYRANVLYSGLCQTDIHQVKCEFGPLPFPLCMGHEIVAVVTRIGKDVTNIQVGDKIGMGFKANTCGKCQYCTSGEEQLCQSIDPAEFALINKRWGGHATAIQQPAKHAVKLPANIPDDVAASLMCAGITTYAPMIRHIKPGDKVGVLGIGGLGHLAVEFLVKYGCSVVAFTSTKEKEAAIKALGAEKVVYIPDNKALEAEKNTLDHIMDTLPDISGHSNTLLLDCIKPNGKFIYLGQTPHLDIESVLPLGMKQLSLVGSFIGSDKDVQSMLEFVGKHKIAPVYEYYDFADYGIAHDKLLDKRPIFRCIMNVQAFSQRNNLLKA